jgi:hypothetical protein
MCWTQPYLRHWTTTNKTNNTTLYVLDTNIHKTQTMSNKTNNTTLSVLDTTIHKTQDDDNHTQDTGRRQTRQITQHYMCWTQPYTRHWTKTRQIIQHYMCWTHPYTRHRTTTNKTNNTTLYVLETTIHKTLDDDKQDK